MIVTKVAIGVGVVLCGILVWMAVSGVAVATELLVSAIAIVVLVGGGNWLSGRGGRAAPRGPERIPEEGPGAAGPPASGPPG